MMVITFYMTDFNAFALTGRDCSNTGKPRVSLRLPWAMGYIGLSGRTCKVRTIIYS